MGMTKTKQDIKDWAGVTYAATELVGKLATTDKGQTVEITAVNGSDARISYPNGRSAWEPMSDLLVAGSILRPSN